MEQMQGRKALQNQPVLTQRVGKEPRGCPRRGWASSSRPGAGLGLLRNFPREGQTTLLSPWGGNGTGHTSHRKLTSKERVREEPWLVPFPGLVFRAAPYAKHCIRFSARFWGSWRDQRGCPPYVAQGHRVVWLGSRVQILGSLDFLVLPKCLCVLGSLVPKPHRIDIYDEYS